jgi:hypothetical protein
MLIFRRKPRGGGGGEAEAAILSRPIQRVDRKIMKVKVLFTLQASILKMEAVCISEISVTLLRFTM